MKANKLKNKASVVDGKLVLSLPAAQNPVVWQMDLHSTKASALEVLPQGEDSFHLNLKTAKGETLSIAAFNTKDEAVNALTSASKALENANGKIANTANTQDTALHIKPQNNFLKTLLKFIGFAGILFFIYILVLAFAGPSITGQQASSINGTNSNAVNDGLPQSADDFLRGR